MTLVTFLRVQKAMPVVRDNSYYIDAASTAYHEVQGDIITSMEQARKTREFMDECRPDVHEIIRMPLAEAKIKLTRWAHRDGIATNKRIEAAKEIWVSSITDERAIQEVSIWACGSGMMA
ncbi:hypothetical protein FOVG_10168 [Fusarium oxysporum f. sp. pisi HDV247]|uniref:Uncharacterized protein n=1 Tax=Fusarium oxysporum f. sp. pisi HDV247 TaxID=1080344 RepID=W9PEA3_FUSOX|nr:hypothetical protein FOVG_10168 [Fusarium oxysporum f. sp. pisi HDV247]